MWTYQTSIVIEAPAATVWRLLSIVTDWPRWLSTVSSVEALDGDALAVGHRFKLLQPKLKPAVWTISLVHPSRRFAWQSRSPGMRMVAYHEVERLASYRTLVRLRFEFHGLVGTLLGRIFSATTKRYVDLEARALKAAAEHASTAARGPAAGWPITG